MSDRSAQIEADVATMTTDLEAALAGPSWCSVIVQRRPLDWGEVLRPSGRVVRKLRGRKMRTWDALMDEIGAVLQFPDYFGENLPALDECLSDLDWLPTGVGYAIVLVEPHEVFADESAELAAEGRTLKPFLNAVRNAVETFAEPVELGE